MDDGRDMRAWDDVLSERQRQICEEGWTHEHDDEHDNGELAHAAGCYALFSGTNSDNDDPPKYWPWDDGWKPSEYRRDLVKAAALLVAEIERIDRAEKQRDALDALKTRKFVDASSVPLPEPALIGGIGDYREHYSTEAIRSYGDARDAEVERLVEMLRQSKRQHDYCEDSWYSCPKAPDGCSDERRGPECDCGADEWNAKVDALLREYEEKRDE